MALSLAEDWTEDEQRRFLARAVPLYRLRGTARGLVELLRAYTGDLPVTVYEFDNVPHYFQVELSLGLSLRDPDFEARKQRRQRTAMAIIDQQKPAHTFYAFRFRDVPTMQIGVHSTVGIDTVLGSIAEPPPSEPPPSTRRPDAGRTAAMADYTQPESVDRRLRYFDGQFLREQDFIDEQRYHLDRSRRLARLAHTPGVVEGLTVTAVPNAPKITVSAGTALDGQGRLLVRVDAGEPLDLAASSTGTGRSRSSSRSATSSRRPTRRRAAPARGGARPRR